MAYPRGPLGFFGAFASQATANVAQSAVESTSGGLLDFLSSHGGDLFGGLLQVGGAVWSGYTQYEQLEAAEDATKQRKAELEAQIALARRNEELRLIELAAQQQRQQAQQQAAANGYTPPGAGGGGIAAALGLGGGGSTALLLGGGLVVALLVGKKLGR